MYDDDLSSELMGRCVVPLRSLLDQPKQKRTWFKLRNGPPNLPGGSLELLVHWAHNVPLDLLEQEEALLEQERLELLDAEIVAAQPVAVDADAPGPLAQHVADEARNVKGRPPNTLEVCLRVRIKSSTRLQCARMQPFRRKLFGCASRTR